MAFLYQATVLWPNCIMPHASRPAVRVPQWLLAAPTAETYEPINTKLDFYLLLSWCNFTC